MDYYDLITNCVSTYVPGTMSSALHLLYFIFYEIKPITDLLNRKRHRLNNGLKVTQLVSVK